MRPPAFWQRPAADPGWAARAAAPLSALYAAATARRVARAPRRRAGIPVICAGNINVGGTGKTPTVIALIERLTARGRAPHVISRGYGGSESGPLRVDPLRHDAARTGDEPLLISAFAPCWVGRDRAACARAAEAAGAQVILMDDGFQDPALHKDLAVVVVDAAAGFGNGRVLPGGPLREPVAAGMARADLLLSIGPPQAQAQFDAALGDHAEGAGVVRLRGALEALRTGMEWEGMPVYAFAGIGRPEKMFETLRDLGADLRGTRALDDHQPLSRALMSRMEAEAAALGAQLVTTEKDAVRLPPEFRGKVLALPVRLKLADPAPLDAALSALGL
ncbi:tetraacyldisaccharide 4'-kinase [Profundibacterium mesophilum]|uniref:tetraacyldisaccharide 4'-kinase n=1 Tax=Profundibacterium mesophilum TaxID=1258573 RepID=UPI00135A3B86|nr:tetraacyldisaccharide 4'-kinase [Profundibacterium mesophilum]